MKQSQYILYKELLQINKESANHTKEKPKNTKRHLSEE